MPTNHEKTHTEQLHSHLHELRRNLHEQEELIGLLIQSIAHLFPTFPTPDPNMVSWARQRIAKHEDQKAGMRKDDALDETPANHAPIAAALRVECHSRSILCDALILYMAAGRGIDITFEQSSYIVSNLADSEFLSKLAQSHITPRERHTGQG